MNKASFRARSYINLHWMKAARNIDVIKQIRRLTNVLIRKGADHSERVGLELKRHNWGKTAFGRRLVDAILYPTDIYKIVMRYKKTFGRFPRLLRPKTFNEWVQTSKLIRRKARYTQFADKLAVREFVRKRVGGDVLVRVLWSGTDVAEARKLHLPRKFVMKSNNGSDKNLIVTNAATFDWDRACAVTRCWMATDHSVYCAEWQYRWIKPRIFIEEFLEGPEGEPPIDFKFFCFHGRVELVQVDLDRFTNHTRTMLDRDFKVLPFQLQYSTPELSVPKPACFGRMIEIAEALSKDELFIRVDLYERGKPFFGELTLHPESGLGQFIPAEWDRRLAEFLQP